jgi:hypothetical protein
MRHAKMPMQDHKESCMWPLPAMNTSADTACIRTSVDQQKYSPEDMFKDI